MLKRIRLETNRKSGGKMLIILGDNRTRREATVVTILGPCEVKADQDHPFIWIETTDQLVIDGEHVQ